jgi:hypothetical protein
MNNAFLHQHPPPWCGCSPNQQHCKKEVARRISFQFSNIFPSPLSSQFSTQTLITTKLF